VESQEQGLCGWGGKKREENDKARALAENAFDLNPSTMGFGDPLTDRKPQAGPQPNGDISLESDGFECGLAGEGCFQSGLAWNQGVTKVTKGNQGVRVLEIIPIANHPDPKTTRIYDRHSKCLTLDQVERIGI